MSFFGGYLFVLVRETRSGWVSEIVFGNHVFWRVFSVGEGRERDIFVFAPRTFIQINPVSVWFHFCSACREERPASPQSHCFGEFVNSLTVSPEGQNKSGTKPIHD